MKKIALFILLTAISSSTWADWAIPVSNCGASGVNKQAFPYEKEGVFYIYNSNKDFIMVTCPSPIVKDYGDLQMEFIVDLSFWTEAEFFCKGVAYDITGAIVQETETIALSGTQLETTKANAAEKRKIGNGRPVSVSAWCIMPDRTTDSQLISIRVH